MSALFHLTLIILVGLLGAAWSVTAILKHSVNPNALNVNQWQADPESGSKNANPYQKIRTSIRGALPLDSTQSITFFRDRDDNGDALRLECDYRIGYQISNTRFWTLSLKDNNDQPILPKSEISGLSL